MFLIFPPIVLVVFEVKPLDHRGDRWESVICQMLDFFHDKRTKYVPGAEYRPAHTKRLI